MSEATVRVKDFHVTIAENNSIRVSCTVHAEHAKELQLWYEIHGLPRNSTIECADAFFAPCLLFAMKHHSGIIFDVPISDCIARQAIDLAFVLGTQQSYAKNPSIEMPNIVTIERQTRGGVTGFSAGVDSWFSLKQNLLKCSSSSKKLTYLLVNDVGANSTEQKKRQVLTLAGTVAKEFELGLIHVKSNMHGFLKMNFEKTHTARNASVAHLLVPIADTFYYSSAYTYSHAGVFPSSKIAYSDTITLPLLSSDAITLRSTGSVFSRAEKTREIIDIPRIGERLDVCVYHRHGGAKINCGHCWKCLRTELTLEVFDALSQFEPVFDLDAYRRRRRLFIHEISYSAKPDEKEAFELAQAVGIANPRLLHFTQFTGIKAARRLRSALRSK